MLRGEDEIYEEGEEERQPEEGFGECKCDPCTCETPEQASRVHSFIGEGDGDETEDEANFVGKRHGGFQLDEFIRAKEYFMTPSTVTGLTIYDHLSEVLRKLLDTRNPPNAVDFLEEISMNVKRYRFGMKKDLLRDVNQIPPNMLQDSRSMVDSWKEHAQWSAESAEIRDEDRPTFGGYPNLMRLLYYLEQINVGLPREEMFRIALSVRQLIATKPVIIRARFWGKVIGLYKSYYVVEAELRGVDPEAEWKAPMSSYEEDSQNFQTYINEYEILQAVVPGPAETLERAGFAVTDPEILIPYQETSGLPSEINTVVAPNQANEFDNEYSGEGVTNTIHQYDDDPTAAIELERWHQYQHELMTGFPIPRLSTTIPTTAGTEVEIEPEPKGVGLNRRMFYVTNDLGKEWTLLPDVTPKHINAARKIRWFLTGNLDAKIKSIPSFPQGFEGHYLRAQLARITAGAMVSPRGYYRTKKVDAEYDDEDEDEEEIEEEEDEERMGDDTVYPMKKYKPPTMLRLLNSTLETWVHHTNHILRQGRVLWWNPNKQKQRKELLGGGDEEEKEDDEYVEEEEEEEESRDKEYGPPLFQSLAEDTSLDGVTPWSPRASSSVFKEFQIACVRSNLWPGSTAMCTIKGKVENIYIGDGLKFFGHTYSPRVPEATQSEYREGPELKEITDPTVEAEEAWLKRLELKEVADTEESFADNEEETEDEDDDDDEYTATGLEDTDDD